MSQVCIITLVIIAFLSVNGYPGDTVMLLPPFEVRALDRYPHTPQSQVIRSPQQILHTNMGQKPQRHLMETARSSDDVTFNDFLEALNEVSSPHRVEEVSPQFRIANNVERDSNDSAYHPGPFPRPSSTYGSSTAYGTTPAYGPAPDYHHSPPAALPPAPELPKLPSLKPDLTTLFKPATTKVSSKMSGLLGLILSLFSGSSSGGLQMNGLKDLLIDGILKPLLVAKGGLKSLISKLAIPIIALILINLEVLITVWWLWDDCPVEKLKPSYSYPKPAYNYNNYNSYR